LALQRWGVTVGEKTLLILESKQDTPWLAGRNITYLTIITAQNLNVHSLLLADKIVITAPAVALIHEIFQDTKEVAHA